MNKKIEIPKKEFLRILTVLGKLSVARSPSPAARSLIISAGVGEVRLITTNLETSASIAYPVFAENTAISCGVEIKPLIAFIKTLEGASVILEETDKTLIVSSPEDSASYDAPKIVESDDLEKVLRMLAPPHVKHLTFNVEPDDLLSALALVHYAAERKPEKFQCEHKRLQGVTLEYDPADGNFLVVAADGYHAAFVTLAAQTKAEEFADFLLPNDAVTITTSLLKALGSSSVLITLYENKAFIQDADGQFCVVVDDVIRDVLRSGSLRGPQKTYHKFLKMYSTDLYIITSRKALIKALQRAEVFDDVPLLETTRDQLVVSVEKIKTTVPIQRSNEEALLRTYINARFLLDALRKSKAEMAKIAFDHRWEYIIVDDHHLIMVYHK